MKKIWFNIITILLMSVITVAMIGLMFTGRGLVMSIKADSMAKDNADNINVEEREKPTGKAQLDYDPYAERKITEETFNHIYIDGQKYDFPLNLNQLPEEFSWVVSSCSTNGNSTGEDDKYTYWLNLYYNDVLWAYGFYHHGSENYIPEEIVVTRLSLYAHEGTEYVPEIIVGGFDIRQVDTVSVNKAFGNSSDDYGYECFSAPADGGKALIRIWVRKLEGNPVGISRIDYVDEEFTSYMSDLTIYNDSMELTLPDNYDREKDPVNNSLKYQSLPEESGEMRMALENMKVDGEPFKLPCTVNAMLDAFGYDEEGKERWTEQIRIRNTDLEVDDETGAQLIVYEDYADELDFTAIIEPGQDIGDATVISVGSRFITFDNIHSKYNSEYEGTGESGFEYDVNYTFTSTGPITGEGPEYFKHYLTDYEYNNVYVETVSGAISYIKVSYWPENLKKVE